MAVEHYENFPVASVLLPARLRPAVEAIYHFARSADDIADEGDATPAQRLAALSAYEAELDRIEAGQPPEAPGTTVLFANLGKVVKDCRLPLSPLRDLLSAFKQDVVTTRYADFASLLDYCRRSADPVGRMMLHLYGVTGQAGPPDGPDTQTHARAASGAPTGCGNDPAARGTEMLRQSDAVCSSLQLINFWQDVAVDWNKQKAGNARIYLPLEDLRRFGVDESTLEGGRVTPAFRALMAFEVDRARGLMLSGAPLALRLPGRIGWELRLVVQGGLRILEAIEAVDYDVFKRRPKLGAADWLLLGWRALTMRSRLARGR
jgi:phytoene/squalene synthetase